jgi:hypothetical protein
MTVLDSLNVLHFDVEQKDPTLREVAQSMNMIIGYTIYQLETDGCDVDVEVGEAVVTLSKFVYSYHNLKLTGETNVQSTKK